MNVEVFVQNVKHFCAVKGVSPTAACRECGVGTSFLPDVKRGRLPSIDKFEKIASYLGVTVSELLGEDASESSQGPAQPYLVMRYNQLSQENQEKVMAFVEFTALQEKREKEQE